MLTRNAINAAHPVASSLAAAGTVLSVDPSTPLGQMVGACQPQADLMIRHSAALESISGYDVLLENASKTALVDGVIPHDGIKQDALAAAKLAVSGNLSIARNVVNPAIKKVVDEVNAAVDADSTTLTRPMNVIPLFYKPIWDSAMLPSLAGRHAGQFNDDLVLRPLGLAVPESLDAIFVTGVPSIDAELSVFAKSLDPSYVAQIWSETFGAGASTLASVLYAPLGTPAGVYGRIDAAIIVYLAARYIGENVPAGVNMDLGRFRGYATEIMARAGQGIMSNLQRRSRDIQRGLIVVSVPRGAQGNVYVLADSYNRFLANGGSPEVVFGAVIGNRVADLAVEMDPALMAALLQDWKRTQVLLTQQALYRRQDSMVRALAVAVSRLIVDLPEDQRIVPAAKMQDMLKAQIQKLANFKQEDLWAVARSLVCGSVYAHTDAEAVILAIDSAATANPDLDIREAALLGTIDYVVQWLVEQVVVNKLKVF